MKTVKGAAETYIEPAHVSALKPACQKILEGGDREIMVREAKKFLHNFPYGLTDFPRIIDAYSRTILCRLEHGPEAMIARWSRGAATVIHGHPEFGFYHLLVGSLMVEKYERSKQMVRKVSECILQPGESFTIDGVAGRFDNGIHRIHVLKESLSFHIYSDNALKGVCFDDSDMLCV